MSKLEKLSFNDVLKWHALAAGPAGLVLVMLPHRLFAQLSGAPYSPAAHEVARCYGALTAAQAWFAWRTRRIACSSSRPHARTNGSAASRRRLPPSVLATRARRA